MKNKPNKWKSKKIVNADGSVFLFQYRKAILNIENPIKIDDGRKSA